MSGDDPIIAPSARRHGVSDDTMMHAFRNPVRAFELDDGFTMLIGGDVTGALYEIGVVDAADGTVIVHAMPARDKFLR